MIKIAVAGAEGRMGQLIAKMVEEDPEATLVAKMVRGSHNIIEMVPMDVLIDFTTPKATLDHVLSAVKKGCPIVIGTTGFTEIQENKIKEAARSLPIVFSPNMSVGINVSYKLLELAAKTLKNQADIAISEIHHKHKKDTPSGTALQMAKVMDTDASIASLRVGNATGNHTVLFSLEDESIEITHRATNRTAFAKGALKAAKWILHQKPGLYDMQDVLGFYEKRNTSSY